jgi:hypothetical protein
MDNLPILWLFAIYLIDIIRRLFSFQYGEVQVIDRKYVLVTREHIVTGLFLNYLLLPAQV